MGCEVCVCTIFTGQLHSLRLLPWAMRALPFTLVGTAGAYKEPPSRRLLTAPIFFRFMHRAVSWLKHHEPWIQVHYKVVGPDAGSAPGSPDIEKMASVVTTDDSNDSPVNSSRFCALLSEPQDDRSAHPRLSTVSECESGTSMCVTFGERTHLVLEFSNAHGMNTSSKDRSLMRSMAGFLALGANSTEFCHVMEEIFPFARTEPGQVLALCEDRFPELLGRSDAIKNVKDLLGKAAKAAIPVLITGETGTGKGLCASILHNSIYATDERFVVIDGTLLHHELALSELFGHTEGAFTGATHEKLGIIEEAEGGTLFIDEIADAPAEVQSALLRLVDERRFRRVGGHTWRNLNCHLVCATRRNLREMISSGRFRSDLYYRISGIRIHLPPLRERREDILLMADSFMENARKDENRRHARLTARAREALLAHSWPGNVRELKHTIDRALVLGDGPLIGADHLGLQRTNARTRLPDVEKNAIVAAMNRTGLNQRKAARLLGIPESSLRSKLKKHGLKGKSPVE